jgi:Protein of unknown function (DUF2652)
MLPKPELSYFAIADIAGYTSFLAGVELDHAQDIIADLMDTVVKGLRPPFRLAKFEGDAAFVYAVTEKADGSLLQDSIESAYFKFRRRLRDVRQASVCECKACVAIGDLDFKFVVHHGRVEVTREDAYVIFEHNIAAPRQAVWEYITVPGQWQKWWPADAIIERSGVPCRIGRMALRI